MRRGRRSLWLKSQPPTGLSWWPCDREPELALRLFQTPEAWLGKDDRGCPHGAWSKLVFPQMSWRGTNRLHCGSRWMSLLGVTWKAISCAALPGALKAPFRVLKKVVWREIDSSDTQ